MKRKERKNRGARGRGVCGRVGKEVLGVNRGRAEGLKRTKHGRTITKENRDKPRNEKNEATGRWWGSK